MTQLNNGKNKMSKIENKSEVIKKVKNFLDIIEKDYNLFIEKEISLKFTEGDYPMLSPTLKLRYPE